MLASRSRTKTSISSTIALLPRGARASSRKASGVRDDRPCLAEALRICAERSLRHLAFARERQASYSQTVDGAIPDASGRQTIWSHRVYRQRAPRRARFRQQLRPSETTRAAGCHFNVAQAVTFQPCGRSPVPTPGAKTQHLENAKNKRSTDVMTENRLRAVRRS